MAVGDKSIVPAGGIQSTHKVTCCTGTTTTSYFGTDKGTVKSMTTAGVLADLTTKVHVKDPIAAIAYTGLGTANNLVFITTKGDVYTCSVAGATLTKIASLNMSVSSAYYYNKYLYVFLDGMQQEKSSLMKVVVST